MNNLTVLICFIPIFFGILIFIWLQKPISQLSEIEQCPFCYGRTKCKDFHETNIKLQYTTLYYIFYNLLSVKNVYFAKYQEIDVVLKKLAHTTELNEFKSNKKPTWITNDTIINFLNNPTLSEVKHFKTCDHRTSELFLNRMLHKDLREVWTLLQINVEPLILEIFRNKDGWFLPELLGYCGLMVIEKNHGLPLNYFENHKWYERAHLAKQLLKAGLDFTEKHPDFNVYLTDIAPDNISVDENMDLFFVDLENVILQAKSDNKGFFI